MAVAMNLRPTDMVELLADTFTKVPLVPTVGPPPENWDKFRHPTAPLMQQPDTDFTLHELHERTMCVKAGNAVSNPRKIIRGVPQGSVVSPLLFALAIASLPAAARVGEEPAYPISMAVYADDVALWSTAPSYRRQRMDAVELQQEGNNIAFQWLPSHCGIRGNEVVDFLAVRAHKDPECPLSTVPRFSDAKLLVRRAIALQHPDPVVVAGAFPARVPRGFDRQTAAVMHRLRTGSAFTPAWISRFRLSVDPICQTCEETADAEHLLLHCSDHEEERTNLRDAFSRLGLPSTNLEELLRPRASRATTDKALKSVVSFLRSAELLEIL
ncbi:uncharacterized protein ISCGN_026409 [Ixodes scapularis]